MSELWERNEDYHKYSSKRKSIADTFGDAGKSLPYIRKYLGLDEVQLRSLLKDAEENKWDALDLSNTGISTLPEELFEITTLKVLWLGNNYSNNAPKNTITVIQDDIEKLNNLEAISLYGLKDIKISKQVKSLPNLAYVDCFKCDFNRFPSNLMNRRITGIGIDCNNESVLLDICRLKNIKQLFLTFSKLTVLSDAICNLHKLEFLSICNTKIERIPNSLYTLSNLRGFYISQTPLKASIPEEIMGQSARNVVSYICRQQIENDQCFCNEAKMIIVGQGNVGKSCLLERISNYNYEEKESTEGIDVKKWTYTDSKNNAYTLNIWDFGGQEIYHSTHQFFLTKRSLYIFVWDARAEEEYGRIDYWLKTIESFAEDSPIIIAINKCDNSTTRINRIDFGAYKDKYPQIHHIIEISCKDNININRLRGIIKREAKKLAINKVKWLNNWFKIRMELEKMSGSQKYISYGVYNEICTKYGIENDEMHSLSKYLHDLGIILHYGDDLLLRNLIILSPEWATGAVYKILDSQETVLKNRNGILKTNDLSLIWLDKKEYPEDTYVFLLKIMEKFQLCFEIDKESYLVAELLENAILPLPKNWVFEKQNTIRLIYRYDFMPAGVMTRFIVNANKYLAMENEKWLCWKKGAYLSLGSAYASVIMTDSISEKKIEVKVSQFSGKKDSRELLQVIRCKLSEINSSFKKLNVQEFVPCNCNPNCNFLYPYNTLCKALDARKETIECHESFENVNIMSLLEGIEIIKNKECDSMYNIKIENNPKIIQKVKSTNSNSSEVSQNIDIKKIHDNLLEIQGDLNELLEEMEEGDEKGLIEEIEKANNALDGLEDIQTKEEIIRSGKLNKLKRLIEGLSSEDGEYRKFVSGAKNLMKIVGSLVSKYNVLAAALGINTFSLPVK